MKGENCKGVPIYRQLAGSLQSQAVCVREAHGVVHESCVCIEVLVVHATEVIPDIIAGAGDPEFIGPYLSLGVGCLECRTFRTSLGQRDRVGPVILGLSFLVGILVVGIISLL